jgi:hexosaminidase
VPESARRVVLVPQPSRLVVHDGWFELTPATRVCAPEPLAELVRELLGPATGFPFPPAASPGPGVLTLWNAKGEALGAEGYRLTVARDRVQAVGTEIGLRWAVQSLRQLLPVEIFKSQPVRDARWPIPCVDVLDGPRYEWRGSLLDVARWCHPIEFLHRYVDLLALHKLNTLHLHLTDDQGWRFEVRRHPRLTQVGGFRRSSQAGHAREGRFDDVPHGGWYTQNQLRDLVAYAARRGVRIMPEIDVPGHMQAAIAAYPWLGNEPDRQLEVRPGWGISSHILGVSERAVELVTDVLDELVEVFPFEYVHLGGDEVPPDEWLVSPAAQERAGALGLGGVEDLLGWWIGRLADHLAKHGRRVAVWDELLDHGAPPGVLIFSWRGVQRVDAARAAGFDVVAVPQEYTYFDWAESTSPHEPLSIFGPLPLEKVYGYRPGAVTGVQGQLWSEYMPTPDLVEYRAFPRLSALAEVAWSGGGEFPEFRRRLGPHLRRLDAMGVRYHRVR